MKSDCLMECDAVYLGRNSPTFKRKLVEGVGYTVKMDEVALSETLVNFPAHHTVSLSVRRSCAQDNSLQCLKFNTNILAGVKKSQMSGRDVIAVSDLHLAF